MMKKVFMLICLIFVLVIAQAAMAEEEAPLPLKAQERMEMVLYGEPMTGGLIERLGKVEKDLFGRELPGSISERQSGLLNFMENGTLGNPSMLFKLSVAEWSVNHKVNPESPVSTRIDALETLLEGKPQVDKPLAMRLERMLSLLFPDTLTWTEVELPANTVFKAAFTQTISPAVAKKGDQVKLTLAQDLVVDKNLVAPRGSLVFAEIDNVKPPRSFGRPSEITFAFKHLVPLGPEVVPVFMGDKAISVNKDNKTMAIAAGTSVVGLVALGPVGLAGGFFVKGDAKEIPAGTNIYLETSQAVTVHAWPVPPGLQGMIKEAEDMPVPSDSATSEETLSEEENVDEAKD